MKIEMLYFAAVADLLGLNSETLELPTSADAATVATLSAHLEQARPALCGRLGHVRFAVNEAFAQLDQELSEGDVVALIPPVAGGAGKLDAIARVAVHDRALSLDEVLELVKHPGAGALATFMGTVRDHSDGREVTALDYSAYDSMAVVEMARILEEIEEEMPVVRLAAHHRVGQLVVGDVAIVCAASSPHRAEAFKAGRLLIDRIKERVPVWKRERGPDGVVWVGWEDARCVAHDHEHGHDHGHDHA